MSSNAVKMAASLLFMALSATLFVSAAGLVLYNNSKSDPALPKKACVAQPIGSTVCYPYSAAKYIKCTATPAIFKCNSGFLYDYGTRKCVHKKDKPAVCTNFRCPYIGFNQTINMVPGMTLAASQPNFFSKGGNWTYNLTSYKSNITLISPASGHCQYGQIMTVISRGKRPEGMEPVQNVISFGELTDSQTPSYGFHRDFVGYNGDQIILTWNDEAIGSLAWWDNKNVTISAMVPYAPQPVYKCPRFPSWDKVVPRVAFPNETILAQLAWAGNVTYTFDKEDQFVFAGNMNKQCNSGLAFTATVKAAPEGYKPVASTISWETTWDQFPDTTYWVGDSVTFVWRQPSPVGFARPPGGVSILRGGAVSRFPIM